MGKFNRSIKIKYSGQVLAVVLVVLFVGVIIALALMARTMSDQRQTVEERSSADSLEIADTVLNSVKDIEFDDLMTWLSEDAVGMVICQTGNENVGADGYQFLTDGCKIVGLDEFKDFTDKFNLDPFYSSVVDSLEGTCDYTEEDDVMDSFIVLFRIFDEDDILEIAKDSVFSFVYKADSTEDCNVKITAESVDDRAAGAVYTTIYGQSDVTGLTAYKPYVYDDIIGQCVNQGCTNGREIDWLDWDPYTLYPDRQTNTFNNIKAYNSTDYYLNELRVRAVGSDLLVSRGGTCEYEQLLWVEAIINCKGSSRGKHFVLSGEDWAPALFDYVLFNGNGTLQYQ